MKPGLERRRSLRHPIKVRLRLQLTGDRAVTRSQTGDLSEGGLHFFWVRALAKGTSLRVTVPVLKQAFKMTGKVVYSVRDTITGLFRTGISFIETSSAFRMKLAEEILRIQKFRDEISEKQGYMISEEEAALTWIQKYSKDFSKIYK